MSEINVPAVLVGSVLSFALGALWYSPLAFMRRWVRETGVDPDEHRRHPVRVFGLAFVFTVLSAFALAVWLGPAPSLATALTTSLIAGLCLVGASMGINYQFAHRSAALLLIDGGFHVVRLALIGVVLGLWH